MLDAKLEALALKCTSFERVQGIDTLLEQGCIKYLIDLGIPFQYAKLASSNVRSLRLTVEAGSVCRCFQQVGGWSAAGEEAAGQAVSSSQQVKPGKPFSCDDVCLAFGMYTSMWTSRYMSDS